jgi:hypothetical protein
MRKLFAVLALVFAANIASAQAVAPFFPAKVQPLSVAKTAADNTPALVIKYYPPAQGNSAVASNFTGTTTVATAATSLTFVVNGAAYTGFEAPVSGALGGVITMSDASADTLGEVVDVINSTPTNFATGYFRAVIAAGLRSDVMSTLALVADAADTDVTSATGEVIYWDSSILDDDDILLAKYGDARDLLGSRNVYPSGAFGDSNIVLQYAYEKITNAGTIGNFTIYAVEEHYGNGLGCVATATCGPNAGSYENARFLFQVAAGATTVAANTANVQFLLAKGEKVFFRVDSSGADTSVWLLSATGYSYPTP